MEDIIGGWRSTNHTKHGCYLKTLLFDNSSSPPFEFSIHRPMLMAWVSAFLLLKGLRLLSLGGGQ